MAETAPAFLAVRDVKRTVRGKTILAGISLDLDRGGCLAVCGPSGCGKTSLLRVIAGLDACQSGSVLLEGRSPAAYHRGEVGMVFQGAQLYGHMTLLENITLAPRRVLGLSAREAEHRALVMLEAVGMADLASQYPGRLSGGECQRGAIVRALAMQPRLLLFDEPTSALDPDHARDVLDLVRSVRRQGQSMIVVTHHMGFARGIADALLVMEQGRRISLEHPGAVLLEPASEASSRLFSGFLPDVSALDRVRLSGCVVLAVPEGVCVTDCCDACSLLAQLKKVWTVVPRTFPGASAEKILETGLADLALVPEEGDGAHLAPWPCDGCLAVAARREDILWVRELVRLAGRGGDGV